MWTPVLLFPFASISPSPFSLFCLICSSKPDYALRLAPDIIECNVRQQLVPVEMFMIVIMFRSFSSVLF